MAVAARATRIDLEALLRSRKLDNTLTSTLPSLGLLDEQVVIPTGIAVLDERLHGGVPRGQVSEVVGPRSSGRTSLLVAMLAGATARGELAALVDTLDMFDAASAAAGGIDLERLLWVRGQPPSPVGLRRAGGQGSTGGTRERRVADPVAKGDFEVRRGSPARQGPSRGMEEHGGAWERHGEAWERAVDRAIKALNLVLQAGGFGLVALDLAEVPPQVVRRLPFTTWLRLQRVIEGSETACVLLGAEPVARSGGGVTIALRSRGQGPEARGQGPGAGGQGPGVDGPVAGCRRVRLFLGFDVEASLSRARWPETTPCRFQIGTTPWSLAPGS